jgi:hypothetical protein
VQVSEPDFTAALTRRLRVAIDELALRDETIRKLSAENAALREQAQYAEAQAAHQLKQAQEKARTAEEAQVGCTCAGLPT